MAARNNRLIDQRTPLAEEETHQAKLRAAVFNGVSETDVKEVVEKIVERAKAGDKVATKMLFDYVMGGTVRSQSIEQHNHYTMPNGAKDDTIEAPAGSAEKLDEMQRRADAKLSVFGDSATG